MKYREIKRCSDLKVSEIALGCEGFMEKTALECRAMFDRALELGINFIDMYSPNPDFRDSIGKAIAGRRERFVLQGHIGSVWENGQYLRTRELTKVREAFEDQLCRLGTEYLDIGMIHYVDSDDDFATVFSGPFRAY